MNESMCLRSKRPDLFFHLARDFELSDGTVIKDVYGQIKSGEKKVEYRPNSDYWRKRIDKILRKRKHGMTAGAGSNITIEVGYPFTAWFVTGYPKGSLPRLEVSVSKIVEPVDRDLSIEFHLGRVEEVSR